MELSIVSTSYTNNCSCIIRILQVQSIASFAEDKGPIWRAEHEFFSQIRVLNKKIIHLILLYEQDN